jgi:hypothetical protein
MSRNNIILYVFLPVVLHAVHGWAEASQSFFDGEWEPRTWETPDSAIPEEQAVTVPEVSFTVHVTDTVDIVRQTIFGNNAAAWTRNVPDSQGVRMWEDERAVRHLRNAGITTLRIPGGAWANIWLWDRDSSHWRLKSVLTEETSFQNQFASWTMSLDEMLQLCDSVGAQPQIIVNAALAQLIDEEQPVAKAAHYAAEWVRYVNGTLEKGVRYWEVDNEDYGEWMINWEVDGDPFTGAEYGTVFNEFADSMKQADPSIRIGAVLYPQFDEYPANIRENWTQDVLVTAGEKMDFAVIHEYFTWANPIDSVSYDEVFAGRPVIGTYKKSLDSLAEAITGRNIPIAMTEYNMRAGNKNTEMISALFIAEALGEFALAGYGLVNVWQINNGSGTDDHGMLARKDWDGSSLVTQEQVEEFMPHPYFYTYCYYRKYFGDRVVAVDGGDETIHLYASLFSDGTAGLVLVNESPEVRVAEIALPGWKSGEMMYRHTVRADSLGSRIIKVNGLGPEDGKVYGPLNYEDIPPDVTALESGSDVLVVTAPPYSVSFMAIEPEVETGVFHQPEERSGASIPSVSLRSATRSGCTVAVTGEIGQLRITLYDLRGKVYGHRSVKKPIPAEYRIGFDGCARSFLLLEIIVDGVRRLLPLPVVVVD